MGIGLKVLVDKEKKRVIFAECDHDFVDVLFSFLTMPIGAILRLGYIKSSIVGIGCMNNLYKSVENVKDYFQGGCKDMLLSPRNGVEAHYTNLKMNINNKDARIVLKNEIICIWTIIKREKKEIVKIEKKRRANDILEIKAQLKEKPKPNFLPSLEPSLQAA
ncbi:uncharacterized protein LOC133791193 [Humulus lupulus]|uniref:uncharacterized protein LOC133791193 n=1 Tax=Humulus lupulus TaxID=3486 RepID=UPI002B40A64B|nr:uncharacterized protein LOC133791193 [Humulus lupulus]